MFYKNHKNKGFSLVEVLVYTGLLLVVVLITSSLMISTSREASLSIDQKNLRQNIRFVSSKISQEIKTSKEILNIDGDRIEYKNSHDQESYFFWDSNNLVLYYNDGSLDEALTADDVEVVNLDFTEDTDGVIKVDINLRKKSNSNIGRKVSEETQILIVPRHALYNQ